MFVRVCMCVWKVLLSLQPDEMWEHVGAIFRELQWCTAVVSQMSDASLQQALAQGACVRAFMLHETQMCVHAWR
jgi:hypothetical protein